MSDQTAAIIAHAKARGLDIDEFGAQSVLDARAILAKHPNNATAKEILDDFAIGLVTGIPSEGFKAFWLHDEDK